MPCYKPIVAYRSRERNAKGKYGITFSPVKGYADIRQQIPCGQCIGCRLERSRQWAIRLVHEKQLHEESCFITLTYDNDHIPQDGSLHVEHFQKFMKRLRKKHADKKIRFFHCGEYGDALGRPHYHAILFGIDFNDKRCYNTNKGGILSSEELHELWPFGFNTVGDVSFESCAYVARYITKKVTGQNALEHYTDIDYRTGEVLKERKPEYITMSRRPGIAHDWFKKYKAEVYPLDEVIMRGRQMKPPRYYDAQFEMIEPLELEAVKKRRQMLTKKELENNTPERLKVREGIALAKLENQRRVYEQG